MKSLIKITLLTALMMGSALQGMEDLNAQLRQAARDGNNPEIQQLFNKGAQINAGDENSSITALMMAAMRGSLTTCQLLLNLGANVNTQDRANFTALIFAAGGGYNEVCKLLISKGADINHLSRHGTALMWAAKKNHPDTCKLLIHAMIKLTPQERSEVFTLLSLKKRNIPELHSESKKIIAQTRLDDIKRKKKQNAREQIMLIANEALQQELLKYLEGIK